MTVSGFRVAPREGHIDHLRRICGYLCKMKHGYLGVRTGEPNYTDMETTTYNWTRTVYVDVKEVLPLDAPKPLGKPVVLTSHVDANLLHDMTTGRSVMAVLHWVNQTPIEWFSKKQTMGEMATYGPELVAAKLAVQQSMGIDKLLLICASFGVVGNNLGPMLQELSQQWWNSLATNGSQLRVT